MSTTSSSHYENHVSEQVLFSFYSPNFHCPKMKMKETVTSAEAILFKQFFNVTEIQTMQFNGEVTIIIKEGGWPCA